MQWRPDVSEPLRDDWNMESFRPAVDTIELVDGVFLVRFSDGSSVSYTPEELFGPLAGEAVQAYLCREKRQPEISIDSAKPDLAED